eukprot:1160645-Pelagomonas_calceolata.AAC.5
MQLLVPGAGWSRVRMCGDVGVSWEMVWRPSQPPFACDLITCSSSPGLTNITVSSPTVHCWSTHPVNLVWSKTCAKRT